MLSTSLLAAVSILHGWQAPPTQGTELASWNGIATYYQHETVPSKRGAYGLEWQCVELANRYLVSLGHRNLERTGHAYSYYTKAAEKGLARFPNGGTDAPRVGDLIVFQNPKMKWTYGHIALVTEVNEHEITLLQQNGSFLLPGGILVRTAPIVRHRLQVADGRYTVDGRGEQATLGWVRPATTSE